MVLILYHVLTHYGPLSVHKLICFITHTWARLYGRTYTIPLISIIVDCCARRASLSLLVAHEGCLDCAVPVTEALACNSDKAKGKLGKRPAYSNMEWENCSYHLGPNFCDVVLRETEEFQGNTKRFIKLSCQYTEIMKIS